MIHRIAIVEGDITRQAVDAIVNAAYTTLPGGRSVAGGGDPGRGGRYGWRSLCRLGRVSYQDTGLWDFMLSSMSYQILTNVSL